MTDITKVKFKGYIKKRKLKFNIFAESRIINKSERKEPVY